MDAIANLRGAVVDAPVLDVRVDLISAATSVGKVEMGVPHYGGCAHGTFQEPQIKRRDNQDDSDVHHQPLPEPVPEEQDVHAHPTAATASA